MNRSLMFLAAFFMTVSAMAQTRCEIRGKLGKLQAPAKVYIGYSVDGKSVFDSADIDNGAFQMVVQVPYPVNALLTVSKDGETRNYFSGKNIAHLYIEPSSIIWLVSDEDIANYDFDGSKSQTDYKTYLAFIADAQQKLQDLTAESANVMQSDASEKALAAKREYLERFRVAMDYRKQKMKEFIQQHPEMYISLDILEEYAGNFIDYRDVEPLFKALNAGTKSSSKGKAFNKKLTESRQTAIGAIAPDFSQKDPQGNKITLSTFKGKCVLLNFWASWSSISRVENQELRQIEKGFKDKNLVVINVAMEQRKDTWLQALNEDKMTGYNTSDLKFMNNEVAQLYDVTAIPQNVLIDASGKIVARNLKGNALEEKLNSLIAQ